MRCERFEMRLFCRSLIVEYIQLVHILDLHRSSLLNDGKGYSE